MIIKYQKHIVWIIGMLIIARMHVGCSTMLF